MYLLYVIASDRELFDKKMEHDEWQYTVGEQISFNDPSFKSHHLLISDLFISWLYQHFYPGCTLPHAPDPVSVFSPIAGLPN